MILHIVPDEKFIDAAYRIFEEASAENNEFIIISEVKPLQYIKKTPIRFIEHSEFQSKKFVNTLIHYEMVILHWLDDSKMQLVNRANVSVKFVWIGWGGDYYDLITGDTTKLLKSKTLALYLQHHIQISSLPLKSKIKQVIKQILHKKVKKKNIINRINFFAPVLYEDYQLLLETLPDFAPKYLSWNYGTLEDDMIQGFEKSSVSGNNILIGNSASYANNHLDIFEYVKNLDITGRQIISPLSYGDMFCRELVEANGKLLFGEKFVAIEGFMPISEYVSLLSSCSIAIMGHLRQQGLGTIVIMIYLGTKVFLDSHNPVYKFFKKHSVTIFSIDELNNMQLEIPLTKEEIEANRNVLKKFWSRDVIIQRTKELINIVKEEANA